MFLSLVRSTEIIHLVANLAAASSPSSSSSERTEAVGERIRADDSVQVILCFKAVVFAMPN